MTLVDEAHRSDDREHLQIQVAEQPELPPCERGGQFLQCVDLVVIFDEPNHMAMEPLRQVYQPRVGPVLQRCCPGEVVESRMEEWFEKPEPH
jgi:hypothetical protein